MINSFFFIEKNIFFYFMTNLYIFLSISLLLSAIFLISVYNPIYKIIYLILLFFFGSSLFLILDFYFLGLTYFIVYIGAITILFLFVIMMVQLTITDNNLIDNNINIVTKSDHLNINNSSFNNPLILLELLRSDNINIITNNNHFTNSIDLEFNKINPYIFIYIGISLISSIFILFSLNNIIGYDFIYNYIFNEWSLLYITFTDIELLGYLIYISYPLTLIIISYLLWLILIGILSVTI